jgi:hypothetical protein
MCIKNFILVEPTIGKYDWLSIFLGIPIVIIFANIHLLPFVAFVSGIIGIALIRVATSALLKATSYILEDFPKVMKITNRSLVCLGIAFQVFIIIISIILIFAYLGDYIY